MITFRGKLQGPRAAELARFTVRLDFERRMVIATSAANTEASTARAVAEPVTTWARVSLVTHPDAGGAFAIDAGEDKSIRGPFHLVVAGPAGETLTTLDVTDPAEEIVVAVPVPRLIPIPDRDPLDGIRLRLTGRVLTPRGEPARDGVTVIIWDASGDGPPRPIVTADTAGNGYFTAALPTQRITAAHATVAGHAAGPIPLEQERLPQRVVLVVDLARTDGPAHEDCACESGPPRNPDQEDLVASPEVFSTDLGGRCTDFTMPNRVLEEFIWSAVVRTTQPNVNAFGADVKPPLPKPLVTAITALAAKSERLTRMSADQATEIGVVALRTTDAREPATDVFLGARAVNQLLNGPAFTTEHVVAAERLSLFEQAAANVEVALRGHGGRSIITTKRPIDWDSTATTYQATSVAHGHVLTMKQVWRADGYSLGDVLYSLPLAPCQKKEIAVVDWDRRTVTTRLESRSAAEGLRASISRDRDVSDILDTALTESVHGGSSASTWAAGGGIGGFIGPLVFGGGGGASGASSSAWQSSARNVAASALQHVSDRTMQAASSTRSQRSTVVQTARQGESMRVETEVVANHNHCHAMTMEFFEVLRHFQVTQELAAVQECLFVPMDIGFFNAQKALRWRELLLRGLRRPELAGGFDAIDRMLSGWSNTDFPDHRYADDPLRYLDGEISATFELPRPLDTATHGFDSAQWVPYYGLLTPANTTESQADAAQRIWNTFLGIEKAERRDNVWNTQLAPRIAQRLANQLKFELRLDDNSIQSLAMDTTLVTRFRQGADMLISVRPLQTTPAIVRWRIRSFRITTLATLPIGGRVIINSASARYRTDHLSHDLFSDFRVMNDLSSIDAVEIPVRLDAVEKADPRAKDRDLASRLLTHLNANLEYYLERLWSELDDNRRYMLLDGVLAPGAGGKSVASVVENRILGIVGNCLVMPVAPGYHLDPTYRASDTATLFDLYRPTTPLAPVRISVPTRGVFAEAVMGACNACEKKDETRFWRWEEAPCGDEPTRIQDVSADSRATAEPSLTPTPFPAPLVRIQNAPDLPAPAALAAAMRLIGTPNLFRDITGLDLNQQNAAQAFQSALDTAQFFGGRAADLAQQKYLNGNMDRTISSIADAQKRGLIDDATAQRLTETALRSSVGDSGTAETRPSSNAAVQRFLDRAAASASSQVNVSRPEGTVSVRAENASPTVNRLVDPAVPFLQQPTASTCWAAAAAMMSSWQRRESLTIRDALAALNPRWTAMFDAGDAITNSAIADLMRDLGLVCEAPMSYLPRGIERLLRTGPLWVITDEDLTNNHVTHAQLVVGITGDGTPDQTAILVHDPSESAPRRTRFTDFAARLEAPDAVATGLGIYHFPAGSQ